MAWASASPSVGRSPNPITDACGRRTKSREAPYSTWSCPSKGDCMSKDDHRPSVFLVDDDAAICRALSRGLTAEGFTVRCWNSARAFLDEHDPTAPGCLVTDVAMPGVNGLELQKLLATSGCARPI